MPEFIDKIERGNMHPYFHQSGNEILNTRTGTRILFRGIRTSSGINTAALKSIPNLVLWVNDESEELVDENVFDTIDLSLRDLESHCEVWLVLNPADVSHFIYRKFFATRGVQGGFNGTAGDVTYIHTTYLDNLDNLDDGYIAMAETMREKDPAKYRHLWLGEWKENREGLIYRNWAPIGEAEWPEGLPQWYGADWGYSDWPNAMVRMCYDPAHGVLYVREVPMLDDPVEARLTRGAAKAVIRDAERRGVTPASCVVYCDPARPENIAEMRVIYDISALPGINRDKVGRIHYLQGFQVRYIGENIGRESRTYCWQKAPRTPGLYLDKPQDGGDHFMDAISYGATNLRRMGVNGDAD